MTSPSKLLVGDGIMQLKHEISRLQDEHDKLWIQFDRALKLAAEDKAENENLRREVNEWRACARYDPTMEGPVFKGWDRSQMDRCRKRFIESGDQ